MRYKRFSWTVNIVWLSIHSGGSLVFRKLPISITSYDLLSTFTLNPGLPWLLIALPSFAPSPWDLPQSGSCLRGNTTQLFFIKHFRWLWGNLFINRKLSAHFIHGTENSQGSRLDHTPSMCLCPCSAECVSLDFSGIFSNSIFWQRNTHFRRHFSFNILLYLMLGQGQGGNKCVQKINSLSTFANNRRITVEDSKTYHLVWWNFIKIHCDGLKIQIMRKHMLTFSRPRINSQHWRRMTTRSPLKWLILSSVSSSRQSMHLILICSFLMIVGTDLYFN